jgi:hypothetical protein
MDGLVNTLVVFAEILALQWHEMGAGILARTGAGRQPDAAHTEDRAGLNRCGRKCPRTGRAEAGAMVAPGADTQVGSVHLFGRAAQNSL